MIIGSGLLARAFASVYGSSDAVCIYCAGVSNSGCRDPQEFAREKLRLTQAIATAEGMDAFVYFGTCSADDPEAVDTPYVQHKLAMEQLAAQHRRCLIVRLPQVAGRTPNPHTLLNYLYGRISRSEAFSVWRHARRNIIDVDDVVAITRQLIADAGMRSVTVNVANTGSYPIGDIVHAFEVATGKSAVCESIDRGAAYRIDTAAILPFQLPAGVCFDATYLQRVISKYYGNSS